MKFVKVAKSEDFGVSQTDVGLYFGSTMYFLCDFFFSFFFLDTLQGIWDLSSLTRDQTMPPAMEARNLNHWTYREVPG